MTIVSYSQIVVVINNIFGGCIGLNDALCLFGDKMKDYNDFVCKCPRCYQGSLCHYRIAQFGYSLEALLASTAYEYEEENALQNDESICNNLFSS